MKTDTIFYTLLQNLPSVLFELLEQSPTLALHYDFSSVEVKELARRIDGVFLPKPEYPQDPIYFVEVQFQRDDDLYWRLITEVFVYLNQYRPQGTCQIVVLWAKRSIDSGVPTFLYQTLLNTNQIHVVYLDKLTDNASSIGLGIIRMVVASENDAVQEARALINQVQQADATNRANLLELVERILIYKFSDKTRQELEAMFGLTEWRQTKFYQEVKEEVEEELKEKVKGEVEEELKEKVKEEAELNTKLETIPELLKVGLNIEQIAQALKLDIEVVRNTIGKLSRE